MITIELGDGTHGICDLVAEDGSFAGISFKKVKEPVEVGYLETFETPRSDEDCYLRIVSDNMKSLDVLIERLQVAKQRFLTQNMEANNA